MKLIATLLLLGGLSAHGRVGETAEEVQARYGAGEVSDIQRLRGAKTFKYVKGSFAVEVVVHDGKSIWEIIKRHDGDTKISEAEIKEVLNGYAGMGNTWRFDKQAKRWERSGRPKLVGYRWPGHEDYFCVKDIALCDSLQKSNGPAGI